MSGIAPTVTRIPTSLPLFISLFFIFRTTIAPRIPSLPFFCAARCFAPGCRSCVVRGALIYGTRAGTPRKGGKGGVGGGTPYGGKAASLQCCSGLFCAVRDHARVPLLQPVAASAVARAVRVEPTTRQAVARTRSEHRRSLWRSLQ